MLRPALSAAKGQFVDSVSLQVVGAVKTGKGFVICPIGRKRMEDRPLVFTVVDGLREHISGPDRSAATQPPIHFGLQRIVISDFERSHCVDIAPAVRGGANGRVCVEQATRVSTANGASIDVEPEWYAYAAGSNIADVSHPAGEVMLHH